MTTPPFVSPHSYLKPSDWVTRWSHLVKENGCVLDVACGFGRHMQWFKNRRCTVTGVDRAQDAITAVANIGEAVLADIENGPWPFFENDDTQSTPRRFDAVVVTNYLWRPLLPRILDSIKPGGVLLYETFAVGNEAIGKPNRPDFLLKTGELLEVCNYFKIIAFEDVFLYNPARFVQRIAATK